MKFPYVVTEFESPEHGTVTVCGKHVAAERSTGTPAHFKLESACAYGTEIELDLSDADVERASDALFLHYAALREESFPQPEAFASAVLEECFLGGF